jgi:hypothetical protein
MPKADTDHTPATPILPKMHSSPATVDDDAELIRLCEQIVAREAEEEALCDADPHAPDAGPHHVRYLELMRQFATDSDWLYELPGPTTPEGARAVARAALAIVPRTTAGEILTPRRSAERLALSCAEFLAAEGRSMSTIDEPEGWPTGALEPVILDLQTTVAVFGHLINSPDEIGKNTWAKVETDLIVAAGQIRELWKAAWEQRIREDRAHREALDAVRAEKAAPGSAEEREQVEALWVLLRSAVTVAAGQCHEAGYRLPGWRWEGEERS